MKNGNQQIHRQPFVKKAKIRESGSLVSGVGNQISNQRLKNYDTSRKKMMDGLKKEWADL